MEELLRRQKKRGGLRRKVSSPQPHQAEKPGVHLSFIIIDQYPNFGYGNFKQMAEEEGRLVQSLESRILDLPPSCVEFCPAYPSYFLVGTYSLQPDGDGEHNGGTEAEAGSDTDDDAQPVRPKQPQSRNGSVIAFKLSDGVV